VHLFAKNQHDSSDVIQEVKDVWVTSVDCA